jgi:Fe-S-cluster-containing hydrogenase component 2
MNIDSRTGARYIDNEKCIGCGRCVAVCPLMPEKQVIRFKSEKEKKLFFKCDLCKDRVEGPICVQNCPALALVYSKAGDKQ